MDSRCRHKILTFLKCFQKSVYFLLRALIYSEDAQRIYIISVCIHGMHDQIIKLEINAFFIQLDNHWIEYVSICEIVNKLLIQTRDKVNHLPSMVASWSVRNRWIQTSRDYAWLSEIGVTIRATALTYQGRLCSCPCLVQSVKRKRDWTESLHHPYTYYSYAPNDFN